VPSVYTCVDKVQQDLEDPGLHAQDLHLLLVGLLHAPGEEGAEVGAAGGQHQPVHPERPLAHAQPHVTEVRPQTHAVHLRQDEPGVAVRGKGHLLSGEHPCSPDVPATVTGGGRRRRRRRRRRQSSGQGGGGGHGGSGHCGEVSVLSVAFRVSFSHSPLLCKTRDIHTMWSREQENKAESVFWDRAMQRCTVI